MDLKSELGQRYLRVIAMVALVLGLSDAARLLGVSSGPGNPIDVMGVTGFVWLSVFCLARLFSAVGLWIGASWGAITLFGAIVIELGLYLSGQPQIQVAMFDLIVRLVLLIALLVYFAVGLRVRRAREQ